VSRSFPKLRSRLIADSDIEGVATLLARGFRRRTRGYWLGALGRLAKHPTPLGFPKYGYLMEADGTPVGVILLIFSTVQNGNSSAIRCNVSSWYVEPPYRSNATLLISQAVKKKDVTYVNISPASHVQRIVEAQGFSRYSNGQFVAFPALFSATSDSHCKVLGANERPDATFESFERDILLTHAEYGCTSFWITSGNRAYPFVFLPRIVKGCIPCTQLLYCRSIEDFVRFSRPIGSFLLWQGRPLVLIDSNGPIPGLFGKYFEGVAPKYFKGLEPPRLGDLAYTEAAMFGL
jgi:hypothetical protein